MRSLKRCFLILALFFVAPHPFARAQSADPAPAGATKEEVEKLRREVAELKAAIQRLILISQQGTGVPRLVQTSAVQPEDRAAPALAEQPPQAATGAPSKNEQKPPTELKFPLAGGQVQLYGHADVSYDYVDNGLANRFGAVGNNGWLGQVSSNLSNFGIRGSRPLLHNLNVVFQIETEVAFSSTPGPTTDSQVKQGLGSRDTYVGLQGNWGAVKIGKEDAPYKRSTGRLDPFINTIGDSRSIIGNSGGDNRSEFNTRVPHSLWYESPKFNGFAASVLFSPGQNRANDNIITARVEPNCTGGNDPPCNDGAFGNVVSTSLTYTNGPFYALFAFEHHANVNRTGDEGGSAVEGVPPPGSVGIADESAWKFGAQYTIKPTRTTVGFVFEGLTRHTPADPRFDPRFNERSRPVATWLSVVQKITPSNDLNFGWAHAGKTPGDPGGQINQPPPSLLNLAGPIDNRTNLIDIGFKHHFSDKRTSAYFVYAQQMNHQGAHYDLGANGHGAVVDRADANGTSFTGLTHRGLSVGLIYDF